jgi:hypothetical protein
MRRACRWRPARAFAPGLASCIRGIGRCSSHLLKPAVRDGRRSFH